MRESFSLLSLSHKNAPVEIREQMHLDDAASRRLSLQIKEVLDLEEVLVLSTCNRTEVYFLGPEAIGSDVLKLLAIEKGLAGNDPALQCFVEVTDHAAAVRHLFEVSMGLHSQVVGDLQISNQVKQAYARAAELKLAGPLMHRLLHTIFHANKRVQQETAYRDGAASISYAAADLVQDLVALHGTPNALVIGTGEMGADVARCLAGAGFDQIALTNRTDEKAEDLANEIGARWIPWATRESAFNEYLVIVSAVGGQDPILREEYFRSEGMPAQKFIVDLSVPRSVARDVDDLPGMIVYDIDEIRARTDETLARRLEAVPKVQAIIDDELRGFDAWSQELTISPTIQKLKDALEQIRRDELSRFLKKADEGQAELVDKVTKSMMNKILKLPVLQLKAACQRGEQETLIDVLNDLFDLERARESVRK